MRGESVREKDDEVRYDICVRLIMPVAALSVPPDGHI